MVAKTQHLILHLRSMHIWQQDYLRQGLSRLIRRALSVQHQKSIAEMQVSIEPYGVCEPQGLVSYKLLLIRLVWLKSHQIQSEYSMLLLCSSRLDPIPIGVTS